VATAILVVSGNAKTGLGAAEMEKIKAVEMGFSGIWVEKRDKYLYYE
jgi:hypothetical protein